MKVGAPVWYLPNRGGYNGQPSYVNITKVGREYLWQGEFKISKATGLVHSRNGQYYCGKCYLHKSTCDTEQERAKYWSTIRYHIDNTWEMPPHLGVSDLKYIASLLGVNLSEEPK